MPSPNPQFPSISDEEDHNPQRELLGYAAHCQQGICGICLLKVFLLIVSMVFWHNFSQTSLPLPDREHLPCTQWHWRKTVFHLPAGLRRKDVWSPVTKRPIPHRNSRAFGCTRRLASLLKGNAWGTCPQAYSNSMDLNHQSQKNPFLTLMNLFPTQESLRGSSPVFFLDLPSSPWWTIGTVISGCRAAPVVLWYIKCFGLLVSYLFQKVRRTLCIDVMSPAPANLSNSSYSIMYFSHELNLTKGNSFMLWIWTLLIFTGKLCPNWRKTLWACSSLSLRCTFLSWFSPFDETRVTRAWRMASAQETSGGTKQDQMDWLSYKNIGCTHQTLANLCLCSKAYLYLSMKICHVYGLSLIFLEMLLLMQTFTIAFIICIYN